MAHQHTPDPGPVGRVAIVTGAGRGLGRIMATALLQAGVRVLLTSTRQAALKEAIEASGAPRTEAVAFAADLADPDATSRIVDAANEAFGRVDIVVNNAAFTPEHIWPDFEISGEGEPWGLDAALYRRMLEINAVAPHVLAATCLPAMIERGWGRIINVSTSLDTMLRFWPYGSTKAALEAQTAVLAARLQGTGVTANALLPGGHAKPEPYRGADGRVIRPVLPPAIMAKPVVWLASEASDGITGRRFLGALWDSEQPDGVAADAASFPVAWTGLGQQSIVPAPS